MVQGEQRAAKARRGWKGGKEMEADFYNILETCMHRRLDSLHYVSDDVIAYPFV